MAHMHDLEMRETKGMCQMSHFSFLAQFCPESSPFHLFSAPPTLVKARESLMFSWGVTTALTRLICLRRHDERERDGASKDAT